MATFIPTPFTSPIVTPGAIQGTVFRTTPYISPSEYRNAPTAVSTSSLVPGGSPQDSTASLAQVVARASGWIDTYCYHAADGTFAASPSTEAGFVKVKPDGTAALVCRFKPILAIVGAGIGPSPSQQQSIDSVTAQDMSVSHKTIWLPGTWATNGIRPFFGGWPSYNGMVYVTWTYVNGYPHMALSATASSSATSITVSPTPPGGTTVSGVYAGTALTIHDGTNTEVVVAASTPAGLTINLQNPLANNHTVPAAPDTIRVSAVPWAVEQACISITNVLLKTQGMRAQALPAVPGNAANRQLLSRAGALDDYDVATKLLKPYVMSTLMQK